MGKASSAKKVARAARSSGASRGQRPKLSFPLAIVGIVLAGALLVVYARTSQQPAEAAEAPSYTKKDHWHTAYGVYVCDKYLPTLPQSPEDKHGIHTHGDGVIHVHPFDVSTSGSNARLGKFTDIPWDDDGFTYMGQSYANGYSCNGKPAKVVVYKYPADDPNAPAEVFERNWANIPFTGDRYAMTIAVVPDDAPLPPPPDSVKTLDNLTDVDAGSGGSAGETAPLGGATTGDATTGLVPSGGATGDATTGGATTGGATTGDATTGGAPAGGASVGASDPAAPVPSSTP